MTGKTAVVFTCAHSDPDVPNDRADWLGRFLYDLRPDYVVDLGDTTDMRSLNSYDTRYPQKIVGQSYAKDINHSNDFQERIRWKFKKNKVKRPRFYGFMGNHEVRILTAIAHDPRLEGDKSQYGISFKHLETDRWYDEYHPYEYGGPAIRKYDGVNYAHFVSAGNYGTAMSGEYHAANLIKKTFGSATVGHSHKRSMAFNDAQNAIGLVAGCFKGAKESWAGQANNDWWGGVVIKRNIENGYYDPQFVSIQQLKEEYS